MWLILSWRRKWQPTPVFLPGKSHGQRSLEGYSPRGWQESDMTEWLSQYYPSCLFPSVVCICSFFFFFFLLFPEQGILHPGSMGVPGEVLGFVNESGLKWCKGFLGGSMVMQETWVWSLGQKDLLEEEMETPLQYSCLENPMDRGAWPAIVARVGQT